MRQYFFESETDGLPFSRNQRAIVYQRAKMALDKRPFGTQLDVYAQGYEWLRHSIAPRPVADEPFRVTVGGPDCAQPYSMSVFNISAMSFGALSANAIRALNRARRSAASRTTPAKAASAPITARAAATSSGRSARAISAAASPTAASIAEKFAAAAANDQIKMIEIKLSQGAKPGHGGVLPGAKVTPRSPRSAASSRARTASRRRAIGAFSTPLEMMALHRRAARLSRRQAGRLQALHRPSLGVPGDLQGDAGDRHLLPISSSSTARRAAPARRRSNSPTISACRCATAWSSCATRCRHRRARAHPHRRSPARSSTPSTWPARWRSAPTGATPRAASCSRSAASSR